MKYFLLAFSVILVLAACNKHPKVTPNRENLMRNKKWKLTDGTVRLKKPNDRDTTLKYMDFLPDCYKDDYLKFDSMHFGKQYINATSCAPSDPEYVNFTWRLWNNDRYIDLYDGFNRVFAFVTSIEPYHFHVKNESPYEVDTLVGRLDTIPGFIKQFIVLDTIRELRYTKYAIPDFDIYGAEITDFTESSFKINFSFKTTRLDSTYWHAGLPNNYAPFVLEDTAHYTFTYTAF